MGKLTVKSPNQEIASPYQNFSMEDMKTFYEAQQFLQSVDATGILDKCIAKTDKTLHYKNTFSKVNGPYYRDCGIFGIVEVDCSYQRDFTVARIVWISTALLMDKLNASLYYWQKLNP